MKNWIPIVGPMLFLSGTLSADKDHKIWVSDWPRLSEAAHSMTRLNIEGAIGGTGNLGYSINIGLRTVKTSELGKDAILRYHGLNRRWGEAVNTQMGEQDGVASKLFTFRLQ